MGIRKIFEGILQEIKVLKGEATKDKLYTSQRRFPDPVAAAEAFARAKEKLFDVDGWSNLSGLTSTFELYDQKGQKSPKKVPEVHDFIRIMLPGPVPENWVTVTDVKMDKNEASFTVSPSRDPQEADEDIEHFFIDEASSTFRVNLQGDMLHAAEIGKNEGINNQGKDAGNRELLNVLISEGGWAAFQELQWKKLTNYLVHLEELET